MTNSNSIVVGSSSESRYGIGTLLKFNSEDVILDHLEDGSWSIKVRLEEGGFEAFYCYNVMKFESDMPGSTIETCNLEP